MNAVSEFKRIVLIVEYDGSGYNGYQFQVDKPTIQNEIEKALFTLCKEDVKTMASGRTDTGVHAVGQVVSFKTKSTIPPQKFAFALNTFLPRDIVIRESYEVDIDFNPRFDAKSKVYKYISVVDDGSKKFSVLMRNKVNLLGKETLDIAKMNEAARLFCKEQDFGSFCSSGSSVKSTVRTVYRFDICEDKLETLDLNLLVFEVEANGFLYNMVRIMSSTLLEIGRGNMSIDELNNIIEKADRKFAPPPACACGLYLFKVNY